MRALPPNESESHPSSLSRVSPRARSRRTVMIPSRWFAPDIDSTETERETDADAPIGVDRR